MVCYIDIREIVVEDVHCTVLLSKSMASKPFREQTHDSVNHEVIWCHYISFDKNVVVCLA